MVNESVIPYLADDIELMAEDEQYYLYHRYENKVLILENAISVEIIKLCNGSNSFKDIVSSLMDLYLDSTEEMTSADLSELLIFLEKENFIQLDK